MALPKLKVYLAARYSRRDELRSFRAVLIGGGFEVTSRWLGEGTPLDHKMSDLSEEYQRVSAEVDLEDIDAADYLILYSEDPDKGTPRGGRHVEFGYALAKGKSIIVIGPKENIFHALPGIQHVRFTWEASDLLRAARHKLISPMLPVKKTSRFDDPLSTLGRAPTSYTSFKQHDPLGSVGEAQAQKFVLDRGVGQVYEKPYPYTDDYKRHLEQTLPKKPSAAVYDPDLNMIDFGGQVFSGTKKIEAIRVVPPGPLPTIPAERKTYPLYSGLMAYFPHALAAVSHVSYIGNEQHNPGQPLHWAREKSSDHKDTAARHLLESGKLDTDGLRHTAKAAWRILAELELEIERDKGADQSNSTKAA